MVKLIDAQLEKLGSEQSWLLDGFPRTMSQAKTLDATLQGRSQPLNLVIHLDVPEEVILQRIMGKATGTCCSGMTRANLYRWRMLTPLANRSLGAYSFRTRLQHDVQPSKARWPG